MHQRTVGSRSRQPRREKIFRPSKEEANEKNKIELRRGAVNSVGGINTNNSRNSSPDRSRPVILKQRELGFSNISRSRSRDGIGVHFKATLGFGKSTDGESHGGTGGLALRKLAEGSPNKGSRNDGHGESGHSYLDEPHLSKLVSRVLRDDDRDRRLSACRQLKDYVQNVDNVNAVQKSGLSLIQELARVFFDRTSVDVKEEVAGCCGLLASMLVKEPHSIYLQWLFRKYDNTGNEEVQLLLLKTLFETLKSEENASEFDYPLIMTNARKVLENTDSQQLLVAIVDIVLVIVRRDPHAFQPHFHDTVDILIGWHIDAQQSKSIIRYTSDALISFNQYWIADIQFSVTLLGQLLEDIEAYTECQSSGSDKAGVDKDLPAKIAALIRVYGTIVSSLGEFYSAERTPIISGSLIAQSFSRLLSSVLLACSPTVSTNVLISANNCVLLLLSHIKEGAFQHLEPLTTLIELQFECGQGITVTHAISLLKLLSKIIVEINCHLPVEFLSKIMAKESSLPLMRFWPNNEVQSHLLELYRAIFRLKTVPLLEEAYRHVLSDLHAGFKRLLNRDLPLTTVCEPCIFTEIEAQTAILFDLCAIAEVGNTRNSLIAMLAFHPSIFDLLADYLKPTDSELCSKYPSLQYAIVLAIYSHCNSHSYFISSSGLINASETAPSDRPTTSGHFASILNILGCLLGNLYNSQEVRYLALKWTRNMFDAALIYIGQICGVPPFTQLVQSLILAGFNDNTEACIIVGEILLKVLQGAMGHLGLPILMRCCELCLFKMSDINADVREFFVRLFALLPVGVIVSATSSQKNPNFVWNSHVDPAQVCGLPTLRHARHRLQSRSPQGTFTTENFRTIMSFILHGVTPTVTWLREIFTSCQRADKMCRPDDRTLYKLVECNEGALWFWAMNEVASFCVLSKLRTPLGKAQETFATVEVAVKGFASEAVGHSISDGIFSEVLPLEKSFKADGDLYCPLLRAKLLLNFLEALEKSVYNAYEGCAVALTSPPKAVKSFFRTNKATCQEWLSRIRKAAMTLACQVGHPAYVVRQGYLLLSEMGSTVSEHDLRQAILVIVRALIDLQCPDPILGLYVWAKEEMGVKLPWVKAAVEMAAGRYEDAAREFTGILNMPMKEKEDSDVPHDGIFEGKDKGTAAHHSDAAVTSFMKTQVLESFRKLGSWTDLQSWISSEWSKNDGGATCGNWCQNSAHLNHLQSLAQFDGLQVRDSWSCCDKTTHMWFLSPEQLQWNVEKSMMAAGQLICENGSHLVHCHDAEKQIAEMFRLSSMDCSSLVSPELAMLHHAAVTYRDFYNSETGSIKYPYTYEGQYFSEAQTLDVAPLVQLLRWIKSSEAYSPTVDVLHDIRIIAARTARKHQNVRVACRQLTASDQLSSATDYVFSGSASPASLTRAFVVQCREQAKLLHCRGESVKAVRLLSTNVATLLQKISKDASESRKLAELNAKSLLTLVKWFQADTSLISDLPPEVLDDISCCPDAFSATATSLNGFRPASLYTIANGFANATSSDVCETDATVGRLLLLSTKQCPWLPKAWLELAGWCYKIAKKSVEKDADARIELTAEERSQLASLLPVGSDEQEVACVAERLSQVHCVSDTAEVSQGEGPGYDGEDMRRHMLLSCPVLQAASEQTVDALLTLWRSITIRAYVYYRVASEAYFMFLKLNSDVDDKLLASSGADGNVIATLRLLRLIVKHASELQDVLEVGLANTPTAPWKGIIPQLFARLNHPEAYVRRSISDLLCRVTAAAPHLIVFPAVVGSSAILGEIKDSSGVLGECLSQHSDDGLNDQVDYASPEAEVSPSAYAEDSQQKAAVMQNCFAAMVETLAKQDPRSIAEVQRLVYELRRITLLWDEFWLGTLNQYHVDFSRRITQLEKEIVKVKCNASLTGKEKSRLIVKKHKTFLKPTLFVLEQLQQVTLQPPETPHEEWFQETFSPLIADVIEKLRCPVTPEHPQASWQLYKQLLVSLQQRVQKRSSSVLNMTQISPALASMKSTGIAMPGASVVTDQIVTIESIDNVVSIMPTKTKPKKLVFYGSDGKKYPFLFKGLEDLHLDERIMQLLAIVNNMFVHRKNKGHTRFQARHYSVTPLGPRSGLIQWVEGATPLFGLYKRWQQREAVAPVSRAGANASAPGLNSGAVLRPSEIYYNKLTPLLKEKGITNLENRKEWPLPVLCQVLSELMNETPRDLLAKELWCASSSALQWWFMTETYAQSTAVMSVIGYIIGLGDRHLDNVLIDLETGEVVHIDYNVCFEKGKNLRVPEKVPFRMTPNISAAMGVTGIEGTFRVSCEHVLKALRRGREMLLTLLDAFVYDPLVDWTPGNEGGYTGAVYGGWQGANVGMSKLTKQDMERSLVNDMFCIRMVEMKVEWLTNRDDILKALPQMVTLLQSWLDAQNLMQTWEEELQELHQEMAFLKEAEANPSHPLHTLQQRCVDYYVFKNRIEAARAGIQEKLADCEHWHRLHEISLDVVRGPEPGRWRMEVGGKQELGALTSSPVIQFLQAAGKGQLLQQCEQAEKDVVGLLSRQQSLLQASLETLATYATVVSQAPLKFAEENRIFKWQAWLKELLNDFTIAKCQDVITKFYSSYGMESMDMLTVHRAMSVNMQLQELLNDSTSKLHKLCERLHLENPDGPTTSGLLASIQDGHTCIADFLAEHGKYGAVGLVCVIVSSLRTHSHRLGSLESTALAAGDQLANFTSREGDWFLDEFHSLSSNVNELMSLVFMCDEILSFPAQAAIKAVSAWHDVITSLQELHLNFRTIILPESLKCLLRGDPSVSEIFQQLSSLIADGGIPLSSLVQQLELQVRHVVMEMEPPSSNACDVVEQLQKRFRPLTDMGLNSSDGSAGNLSSGQMLLMGFDGLFTKLETDFWQFRELSFPVLSSMVLSWRKVDIIKDARTLIAPSFLDEAFQLLGRIFFVKRLQTMTDFFALLYHHCSAVRIVGVEHMFGDDSDTSVATTPSLYSEEYLTKPVRCYISEFIRKMMLGLPSQGLGIFLCHALECCGLDVGAEVDLRDVGAENKVSLDDLCRKAVDSGLRQGRFQPSHVNHASQLVANLECLWRKQVLLSRLGHSIMIEKSVLQRTQLQLTFHQWVYEDVLVQSTGAPSLTVPTRSTMMTEMRKNMQGLLSMESNLSLTRERYLSLGNSVEQRLRWAAGANPSISSTLKSFELSISAVNQMIVSLSKISAEVASVCGSILHFEAFRSRTTEAVTSDNAFLQLVNRCQESCLLAENCVGVISPLEEKLLELKSLDQHVMTPEWIASVSNRIANSIVDVQRQLSQKKGDLSSATEAVKSHIVTIRGNLATHHRLMNDVRAILKSMTKYEEQQTNLPTATSLREYVLAYRAYSEQVTMLIKEVLSEELTSEKVGCFLSILERLKVGTAPIYDTLVLFSNQMDGANSLDSSETYPTSTGTSTSLSVFRASEETSRSTLKASSANLQKPAINGGGVDLLSCASPSSENAPSKICSTGTLRKAAEVTRDPRTGKAVQERNSYAVSVWKRVKIKLDGKDPDVNKRLSVAEQVDYIISEATNLDNLASLYEGWTPWV